MSFYFWGHTIIRLIKVMICSVKRTSALQLTIKWNWSCWFCFSSFSVSFGRWRRWRAVVRFLHLKKVYFAILRTRWLRALTTGYHLSCLEMTYLVWPRAGPSSGLSWLVTLPQKLIISNDSYSTVLGTQHLFPNLTIRGDYLYPGWWSCRTL